MSQETREALERAIRAHADDESDESRVVTGWVLGLSSSHYRDDGEVMHSWTHWAAEGMDFARIAGLVWLVQRHLGQQADEC